MLNIFIETNIGADDKEVAFNITAEAHDLSFDHAFGTERPGIEWEFTLEACEGCTWKEAEEWMESHQDKLREEADDLARDMLEESQIEAGESD